MPLTTFLQNTNGIAQPSPAGLGIPGPFSNTYVRSDLVYDYAIGGIPFIAAEGGRGTFFRRIYQREFSPIRKDQFDNQQVPGEQSIWGWWLRSQSNFTQGAGNQFLDTTQDTSLSQRYSYSEGLDTLSTPGQISLLQQTQNVVSGTGPVKLTSVKTFTGTPGALALDVGAKTIGVITASSGSLGGFTMPAGLTGVANTFTNDGTNYYFADKTGIYRGNIGSSGIAATKIWNPPASGSNTVVLGWVKGRLIAAWDNSVYELVGTGPALPAPKFTHQNSAYLFTDISETQSAVLVSGGAGYGPSQIHKFTVDSTTGALPTMTSGITAAEMPMGEQILSMYAYIGTFVGIGTNKGFRVGITDTNGNFTYGPLIVQDPTYVGVAAIGGYDRFMFIGNQGNNLIPQQGWVNPSEAASTDGIIRIDLSQQTSTGGQPFANDLMTGAGPNGNVINSIVTFGNTSQLAFAVGNTVYRQNNSVKVTSGYFYTSKIRFNTLEPKHFKYVYMRHPNITDGSIDIYGQNPSMSLNILAGGISGSSTVAAATPFFISDVGNAQEWFQFKFVFHAGTTNTNYSPVLNGYQLRGLPGVSRQVLITVPLLCFDHEDDHEGYPHGSDGFAYQRIKAIENLTASGNLVLFQDLNYNDTNLVIVDDYKFEQQSPELAKAASANNQDSNAHGGYLILTVRVVQ